MARIIPNDASYIAFLTSGGLADTAGLEPTEAEVAAGVNLTPFVMSLNATTQGNVLPTPSFDSLFETSTIGTSTSQFSMDCYRDDTTDTAWDTLPRKTRGYVVVSRFGGSGTDNIPETADEVEVWPIIVSSRSMAGMSNNTIQTFTVTCAVFKEPNEAAVVAA